MWTYKDTLSYEPLSFDCVITDDVSFQYITEDEAINSIYSTMKRLTLSHQLQELDEIIPTLSRQLQELDEIIPTLSRQLQELDEKKRIKTSFIEDHEILKFLLDHLNQGHFPIEILKLINFLIDKSIGPKKIFFNFLSTPESFHILFNYIGSPNALPFLTYLIIFLIDYDQVKNNSTEFALNVLSRPICSETGKPQNLIDVIISFLQRSFDSPELYYNYLIHLLTLLSHIISKISFDEFIQSSMSIKEFEESFTLLNQEYMIPIISPQPQSNKLVLYNPIILLIIQVEKNQLYRTVLEQIIIPNINNFNEIFKFSIREKSSELLNNCINLFYLLTRTQENIKKHIDKLRSLFETLIIFILQVHNSPLPQSKSIDTAKAFNIIYNMIKGSPEVLKYFIESNFFVELLKLFYSDQPLDFSEMQQLFFIFLYVCNKKTYDILSEKILPKPKFIEIFLDSMEMMSSSPPIGYQDIFLTALNSILNANPDISDQLDPESLQEILETIEAGDDKYLASQAQKLLENYFYDNNNTVTPHDLKGGSPFEVDDNE